MTDSPATSIAKNSLPYLERSKWMVDLGSKTRQRSWEQFCINQAPSVTTSDFCVLQGHKTESYGAARIRPTITSHNQKQEAKISSPARGRRG